MDTSMSVLSKGTRTMEETIDTGTGVGGNTEKRPMCDALEIAFAVDVEVVKEHARWWNPALKPQVEVPHSSVMGGVNGQGRTIQRITLQ